MRTIEVTEVVQALKETVEQAGADTYRSCNYVMAGQPHCIAGVVLSKLGVPLEALKAMEKWGAILDFKNNKEILTADGFDLSGDALVILQEAQATQDNGHTWGVALESALNVFERVSQ